MSIRTPQQQHELEHDHPELTLGACGQCAHEQRRCHRKTRFPDHDTAATRAQDINVDTSWTLRMVTYPCPWCRGYHLTKAKPGTARWKRTEKRRLAWLASRPVLHPLLSMGLPVVESPYVADGTLLLTSTRGGRTVIVGVRPLTDVEYAGQEGRYAVRQGLADVLAWLGEPVGPPPVRSGRGRAMLQQLKQVS